MHPYPFGTRAFLVVLLALSITGPTWARPGLYVELGSGLQAVSGAEVPIANIQAMDDGTRLVIDPRLQPQLTTDTGTGPLVSLRLGYNVLGYGALELALSGSGTNLGDSRQRTGVGHVALLARAYPLWHFYPELPVEPWLLIGGGWSIQTQALVDRIAWDGGALHLGFGASYYPLPWLSLYCELRYVRVFHERFWFDSGSDLIFPVSPSAGTGYWLPGLGVAFHFTTAQVK